MNEIINLGNGAMVKVVMLKGERGSNIALIAKTSTDGLVDTYTITLTDGHTTTFQVTNGANIGVANLGYIQTSNVAQKAFSVGEHLVLNDQYCVVTQAIAQGAIIAIGTNVDEAVVGDEIENLYLKKADKSDINSLATNKANESDLLNEITQRINGDANLQSQINQIIAPSGEAPSTAEVENARIGADNVTYATLGDAIRNQVNNINEVIDPTIDKTLGFDISQEFMWQNGRFATDTGGLVNSSYQICTPFYFAYPYIQKILVNDGYEFTLFAFDKTSRAYVGVLKDDGSFGTGSTHLKYLTEYFLGKNQNYIYRFAVRNKNDPGAIISTQESVNCHILANSIGNEIDLRWLNDIQNNSIDLLLPYKNSFHNKSLNGITYTWNEDGSCSVYGTASGGRAPCSILVPSAGLPKGLKAGKSYYLKYSSAHVRFDMFFITDPDEGEISYKVKSDTIIDIPDNTIGLSIRLEVNSGDTTDEIVNPRLLTTLSNEEILEKINAVDTRSIIKSELYDHIAYDNVDDAISRAFTTLNHDKKFLMLARISDLHRRPLTNPYTDDNFYNTVEVIKNLNKRLPLHATLDTGDVIISGEAYREAPIAFNIISEYIRMFNEASELYLYTPGNHDGYNANTVVMQDVEYQMGLHILNQRVKSKPLGKCYYYIDYPDIQTRLLVLAIPDGPNMGIGPEQLQWLVDVGFGTVPNGYGVLMAYHIPTVAMRYLENTNNGLGGPWNRVSFAGVVNAFHNHTSYSDDIISCDFSDKYNVKVIASLCGHTHFDAVVSPGEAFTAYDGVNEPNIGVAITEALPCKEIIMAGTFENVIDILIYLPEENTIVMRRVGNGSDRTVSVN